MDTIFVALHYWSDEPDMSTLEWVFKNYDKDKTKIILTTHYLDNESYKSMFISASQGTYLARCNKEQFQAEIVLPNAYKPKETIMELLSVHGMKKLVIDTKYKSEIPASFVENPFFSCKIWLIDRSNGNLESIWEFGPGHRKESEIMEIQRFKKIANEEIIMRKKFEEKLARMTEQAKINEQKLEQFSQHIEKLKLVTSEIESMFAKN